LSSNRLECLKSVPIDDLEVVSVCYVYQTEPDEPATIETEFWNKELFNKAEFLDFNGRCDCCGSTRLQYSCEIVHKPTLTGYHIGRTCAFKIADFGSSRIENCSVALLERAKCKGRVSNWIKSNPEHAEIIAWAATGAHHIASDIRSKLSSYGSLSTAQIALLYKLRTQVEEKAAEIKESPPAGPAPQGRVEVTGEILTFKQVDGFGYGQTVSKMLVRLTEGQSKGCKVWSTVPAYTSAIRGELITFKATFERSDKDQFFSFGKRPVITQAEIDRQATAHEQKQKETELKARWAQDRAPVDHNDADGVTTMQSLG
jgi:hypothetical protein